MACTMPRRKLFYTSVKALCMHVEDHGNLVGPSTIPYHMHYQYPRNQKEQRQISNSEFPPESLRIGDFYAGPDRLGNREEGDSARRFRWVGEGISSRRICGFDRGPSCYSLFCYYVSFIYHHRLLVKGRKKVLGNRLFVYGPLGRHGESTGGNQSLFFTCPTLS